jgi:TolB-like protein/DNA-binding winged helix-turn-helix (wHTH) protein
MRYRFDDYELDTDRYELRYKGMLQHVEPLVFDLIACFVRNPGRILSRDEIVETVWQGRIVSEATISSCIKAARRALGDSGEQQTYIRTLRGRGFEFTASVSTGEEAEVLKAAPAKPPPLAVSPELQPMPSLGSTLDSAPRPGDAGARPVVAVLPFANLSPETDEYFADGLTEDIVTNIGRFRDLRVISSVSTLQFKGVAQPVGDICGRLGAQFAVQGSVRRAAGRVRISAQLIDGVSGVQLWGDRFDRDMVDIFDLQDEVTRAIAAKLGVAVQDVALQRALTKSPAELDAYDCLLRARRYTSMLSAESHAEARDLLERAVELDPLSSDVHALLANVYLGEYRFDMNPQPNPIGRAMTHALAATQLDPHNAYARCWLAIVHFFRRENQKFEAEADLAVRLNPNDPETLADVGHFLCFLGEFERGAALTRRAQQLNPLHPGWYHFSFARLHYHQKQYEDVVEDIQRTGLPHFYWTHVFDAAAKGQLGRSDAATSLARVFEIKPDFVARAELRKWNAEASDCEHILQGLRKAGLRE